MEDHSAAIVAVLAVSFATGVFLYVSEHHKLLQKEARQVTVAAVASAPTSNQEDEQEDVVSVDVVSLEVSLDDTKSIEPELTSEDAAQEGPAMSTTPTDKSASKRRFPTMRSRRIREPKSSKERQPGSGVRKIFKRFSARSRPSFRNKRVNDLSIRYTTFCYRRTN
jgi:hypothetical protein